jgi:hypothetical protein
MMCNYINSTGEKCGMRAIKGSDLCFTHNPEYAEAKKLAVVKGGLAPKKILLDHNQEVELKDAKDARDFLSKVINEVWLGKIPATPVANTLGFLVRCFLDAHENAVVEKKIEEIEERLEKANL